LERKTLRVAPRALAVTHDRLVRTWILAEIGSTRVEAANLYAEPTDEVRYDLRYSYGTGPFRLSLYLFDRVEFKKRVGDLEFLGRERKGGADLQWTLLGPLVLRGGGVGGEQISILSVTPLELERFQTLAQEWSLGVFPATQGIRGTFRQGLLWGASDFHPQWVEGEAGWRLPSSERRWIVRVHGFAGHPTRHADEVTVYDHYYIGGWETLRGWRLYEYAGPSVAAGEATMRLPWNFRRPRRRNRLLWPAGVYAFGTLQTAAVGDVGIFLHHDPYRVSVSAGAGFEVGVRGPAQLFLEGAWARPLGDERAPRFYLSGGLR
jgi:hypothetical protein